MICDSNPQIDRQVGILADMGSISLISHPAKKTVYRSRGYYIHMCMCMYDIAAYIFRITRLHR